MAKSGTLVKVRLAPSPTGPLHLGTARTALFNFLFARHHGGEFFLRFEDTDQARSKTEYEEDIIANLKWLGLEPDATPIRQSDRAPVYRKYLERLLNEKKAYWCYCTKEELEAERQSLLSQGQSPRYGGRCRSGPPAPNAVPQLIRLKVADQKISFRDLIRGTVSFETSLIGDFPLARNLDSALFVFASAVDDAETGITHVIRGEDHLSNTPKQILIQESLGFNLPHHAHLPLILSPRGGKLSKRDLDKSMADFRLEGYLPEALLNFIALLGWHPAVDREIMSLPELIAEFSLDRVQKKGAALNLDKLDWLNARYLRALPLEKLLSALSPLVPEVWTENQTLFSRAVSITKDRLKKLSDFRLVGEFFFHLPSYDTNLLIWKNTSREKTIANLKSILSILENASDHTEEKIVALADERGRGEIYWPFRIALSGLKQSPPPLEILSALGRDESINRLKQAIAKLEQISTPTY